MSEMEKKRIGIILQSRKGNTLKKDFEKWGCISRGKIKAKVFW